MFDEDERFVTSDFISEDAEIEVGLRPRNLSEYIGQEKAKNNLEIYIKAALERREALDNVLFLQTCRNTIYCLLTKYTGCQERLKKFFIRLWRTMRLILL